MVSLQVGDVIYHPNQVPYRVLPGDDTKFNPRGECVVVRGGEVIYPDVVPDWFSIPTKRDGVWVFRGSFNTEKEMTKILERKTYVLGRDIDKASKDELIAVIRELNARMNELDSLDVMESEYIDRTLNDLDEAREIVIRQLDKNIS